jgi:hypothetical protein
MAVSTYIGAMRRARKFQREMWFHQGWQRYHRESGNAEREKECGEQAEACRLQVEHWQNQALRLMAKSAESNEPGTLTS